jgi:hypothetical protein
MFFRAPRGKHTQEIGKYHAAAGALAGNAVARVSSETWIQAGTLAWQVVLVLPATFIFFIADHKSVKSDLEHHKGIY